MNEVMEIYFIDSSKLSDEAINELMCFELPTFVREKIDNLKMKQDRVNSLLAYLILQVGIKKILGKDYDINNFTQSRYGKPIYLSSGKENIFFNISHTGSAIVVGISEENIGVDMEEEQTIDPSIINLFHSREKKYLVLQKNNLNVELLILWICKESYLKYLGTGLNKSLNSFYIEKESNTVFEIFNDGKNRKYLGVCKIFNINPYKIAICTNKKFKKCNFVNYSTQNFINDIGKVLLENVGCEMSND